MQKLLFVFLAISNFFRKIRYSIFGLNEDDIYDKRIVSGKSWEDYCDKLKLAGTNLKYAGAPQDAFSQAEGIRYLTRLTRVSLEAFVEYADPSFPVFKRMVHKTVKMGADNPDNYYFNAQISGAFEYRIRGKRNTAHYIGFFTQNGSYGTTGGLSPCGVLEGSDLQLEKDGSFEIILSKEKKGKNWLKLESDTGLVMVRQTFYDRFKEVAAEIHIENLDGRKSPDPITPKMIDEGLKMASMFVAGAPLLFAKWAKGFKKHVNQLPQFDPKISNAAGGDANIIYYHSYWNLKEEEALIITVNPPDCDSWNFQLNNYWMESLDYRYHTICISKGTAQYEADGSVRIVVAHRDPGHKNWLDTCDHFEGTMCWRWYRLENGAKAIQPNCEVVPFHTLKAV
ncbi:DUF1214 domain-containing protein [Lutimonas vermicola]|uniref:DUF1214 domain-containing protein n=1 Tax=Lutimonas vermicola TaxID=414288 RepID=A0ABU9L5G0_9FLAO